MLRAVVGLAFFIICALAPARADAPPPYDPYGIGASLDDTEPYPTVASVAAGSPADKAGLKVKDAVIAIDGYAKGTVPFYFFARGLQGPQNSKVELIVMREQRRVLVLKMVRSVRLRH
jgi:C-terminal processing protease CtpA/Prc